jgi:hypothetical protein
MENSIQLFMEGAPIRFTPTGKVFVIDAIRMMSENEKPEDVWQQWKQDSPEIMSCISEYQTPEGDPEPVADSACWEKIQDAIFDHMLSQA